MSRPSAGLLIFRRRPPGTVEVLLVHPGGPLWRDRDLGSWSIPKGELSPGEDPLTAARREVAEETGLDIAGDFRPLAACRQRGGKVVHAWAVEADGDPARVRSNRFTMEWPPRSGTVRDFPEIDRAAWLPLDEARARILSGQRGFLDELDRWLGERGPAGTAPHTEVG
jgi:predicted NUDIX family NTP pyrophosphohydrolase